MSKIIQLNEQLANMIAAGEVVERPFGIIKELIENSIDANASHIQIETKNGGLDFIGVIDNGEGMSQEDLKLAFLRHSTSKIKNEIDLNQIQTLGFRGEALPSIASVSKVEAISNQHQLIVDNGKMSEVIPYQSNPGTSIFVSQLFYKTPARLKHLKTPQYEAVRNLSLVQNIALGYPQISFSLKNDDQLVFQTSGKNDLREVFYAIYGYQISQQGVNFKNESFDFKIDGLYILPHQHRANRFHINIFLNNRLIRYPQITSTILREFRRFMPIDRFPMIVLNITTDAQLVDVNVHPSKLEVRLSKEIDLLLLIEKTLKESLMNEMKTKEITRRVFDKPMNVTLFDQETQEPVKSYETSTQQIQEFEPIEPIEYPKQSNIQVIGQHHGSYILAQDEESLYIFDQHASMERIEFEKVSQKLQAETFDQQMIVPLIFENLLLTLANPQEVIKQLEIFGIFLEPFSERDLVLRSIPLWMGDLDPFNYINMLLDNPKLDIVDLNLKKLATIACHRSIRFNESYSNMQLQHIVDTLLQCEQPYHCPHGRPTFIKASAKNLLKEFSR
ncbi:MAG TPA: DNA mismatch repair endonuclease MutL [Erysipelothrix sp.]|nr:DNA mismatch repair endonuclease MutL [Erysipelothrix sp.]